MKELSTNQFVPNLRDWRNVSDNSHQLTDLEILEMFGNPIGTPDTGNATWFRYYDKEVPPNEYWPADFRTSHKRTFYKYLGLINEGSWNWEERNDLYTTYRQKKDVISSISCQLELSTSQHRRVEQQFLRLDLSKLGRPMEEVAFSLCAITVHSDEHSIRKWHPRNSPENKDSLFRNLEEYVTSLDGITTKTLNSRYYKLEKILKEWPELPDDVSIPVEWRPNGSKVKFDKFGMDSRSWRMPLDGEKENAGNQAKN